MRKSVQCMYILIVIQYIYRLNATFTVLNVIIVFFLFFVFFSACSNSIPLLANLPDSSLTADSTYLDSYIRGPGRSRLHTATVDGVGHGGWATGDSSTPSWIQADLLDIFHVDAVATQGRDFVQHFQWATEYTLAYGNAENTLQPVLNISGNVQLFTGNADQFSVVLNRFNPVRTKFIRLNVVSYTGTPALRWEIYGCFAGKQLRYDVIRLCIMPFHCL